MKHTLIAIDLIPHVGAMPIDFFGRPALAYRVDGQPCASLAICPHLGGPLEWKDGQLVCAWHGQRHDPSTGRCVTGPAPRQQAMILPTRIENGRLTYVWGE